MHLLIVLLWAAYIAECFILLDRSVWWSAGVRRGRFADGQGAHVPFGDSGRGLLLVSPWPMALAFLSEGSSLDTDRAAARFEQLTRALRPLRLLAAILCANLLLVLPALVLSGWFMFVLIPWIAATVALYVGVLTTIIHARRLMGARSLWDGMVLMVLSPLGAVRAPANVSLRALAEFDPLTIASIVTPRDRWLRLAHETFHDHPSRRAEIRAFLQARGAWEEFQAPPEREDEWSARFCPRCRAVYRAAATTCRDCGDLTLVSF